jgi:hypothetical protein
MPFKFMRSWKRERLSRRERPERWDPIARRHFDFLEQMGEDERERFWTHLKVFVWEKYWFGAKGLEVTEEMQVTVAGLAARLSRNLSLHVYDRLTEVIIYPSTFKIPGMEGVGGLGEASSWGTVLLSWDAVRNGLADPTDGHDTSMHEFAHVLDYGDGWFDGTPVLHSQGDYAAWSRVLGSHYATLRERVERGGRAGVLRDYGALNEAEFFAVATEAFFERPKRLRRDAPDLYDELKTYYKVDPAKGSPGGRRRRRRRRG